MSFLEELKRRKVIKVTVAYVVGAWLVLQLADVLSELLDLPDVVGRVVVAAAAIGLPVAIFLSWAYELTADGLKRDSEVTPEARSSGKLINAVVISLLVAALGYFVWESRFRDAPTGAAPVTAASSTAMTGDGAQKSDAIGRSVAVLPFENFSGNPQDEYFADGLADTLLHKLAQIDDLKVIARNSSFQFKGTNQDVREIGDVLGVETILEGSVQRAGEQIRIIAQLVRTSDGAHVWSQTYDDSAENIFALQDRVTEGIVDAFQLSLSAAERERLMRDGTNDPVAYDLLIRALNTDRNVDEMLDMRPEEDPKLQLLQQAVERDPEYALAWVHLSRTWNGLAFATDSGADRERFIVEAEAAAERAVQLDPGLALAHNTLGWVAHRRGERLEAAQHFRRALEIDPNELSAMSGLALQVGWQNPAEALELLDRLAELDPTSAFTQRQRHFMLMGLGRVDEAIAALRRAIELEPDEGVFYNDLHDLMELKGRPDEGARSTSKLLQRSPASFTGQTAMAEAWLAVGAFERAGEWITLALRGRDDSDTAKLLNVERLLAEGDFRGALQQLEAVSGAENKQSQKATFGAAAYLGLGEGEGARQMHGRLQRLVEDMKMRGGTPRGFEGYLAMLDVLILERSPGAATASVPLSEIFAAIESAPAANAGDKYYLRAGLLMRMGQEREAFEVLGQAVADPDGAVFNTDFYAFDVEHSPLLDPMRDDPRFQPWLETHRQRLAAMLDRMIRMEALGEIIRPEMVERMAGP